MTLSYRTYRLEPIYEAQFGDSSYGYRPGRSPHCCLDDLGRTHFDSFWNGCDAFPDDLDKADPPRTYLRLATKGHSLAGRRCARTSLGPSVCSWRRCSGRIPISANPATSACARPVSNTPLP